MPETHPSNEKKPRFVLRLIVLFLFLCLLFGGLAYYKLGVQIPKLIAQGSAVPPPTSVTAVAAQQGQWNAQLKTIGTLVASRGIDVTSEVAGVVKNISFESGQQVEQGDELLSLGDEAEVANLKAAQASFRSANSQYKRSLQLKSKQFVAQNDLDIQAAALNISQAQIESAKVAIDKKTIKAPFSGRLGIRQVSLGEYVAPGTQLVSLQAVDELYLDFTLPEQDYNDLSIAQPLFFTVRSYPDTTFKGEIQAWNPSLDERSRSIAVRAVVDNKDGRLAPGMFAQIEVQSGNQVDVVTVPETAVFYNIYGEAVYVLEQSASADNGEAQQNEDSDKQEQQQVYTLAGRQIDVLYRSDGQAGIVSGLEQGEIVVTSGQLKLYPSLKVIITDEPADGSANDDGQANKTDISTEQDTRAQEIVATEQTASVQ